MFSSKDHTHRGFLLLQIHSSTGFESCRSRTRAVGRERRGSKSRTRAGNTSVMDSQNTVLAKAIWDPEPTGVFLDCVIAEIDKGHRPLKHITTTGWNGIISSFLAATGRRHDIKQLKNKYELLKKDWDAWMVLRSPKNVCTGVGYDSTTGLVTAPDHWWDKMMTLNKNVHKFRGKRLEHEDKMHQVFGGVANTGKRVWNMEKTRSEGDMLQLLDDPENSNKESSGESEPRTVTSPLKLMGGRVVPGSSNAKKDKNIAFDWDTPPSDGITKRKRRMSEGDKLSVVVTKLIEEQKSGRSSSLTLKSDCPSGCGIGDCLMKLSTVNGIVSGDTRYLFALKLIKKDVMNRELLMGLSDDELICKWLDDEYLEYQEDRQDRAYKTRLSFP